MIYFPIFMLNVAHILYIQSTRTAPIEAPVILLRAYAHVREILQTPIATRIMSQSF